jgi:dinuclear metal center YbgI/SA1388 family protein
MVSISDVIGAIEAFAPPPYQESYDNAGLIVGQKSDACTGVLLCLDSTEAVVDEAIALGCNLIVAHHPIVFSGLKSFTGRNYIERVIIKAIKNDIAIYAAHTNLDNVQEGVNQKIAERLGLQNTKVLRPKKGMLRKLCTYVPLEHQPKLLEGLFAAGAGYIGNYSECSFSMPGTGTFKGEADSNPVSGQKGIRHAEDEFRVEVIFPKDREAQVLKAMREHHIYEEVAYEVIALENSWQELGSGLIGTLEQPIETDIFLKTLKQQMQTSCIRHTEKVKTEIRTIALCGGAGSFLLEDAIRAGADIFITGDFKYHQFFDADGKIIIADIGHYESEQFTIVLLEEILQKKFPNFALHLTKLNTNPVKYT